MKITFSLATYLFGLSLFSFSAIIPAEEKPKAPYVSIKPNMVGEPIEEGKDMYGVSYKKYREKFEGGEQWVVLSDPKNTGTMTSKVIVKEFDSPFVNETTTFELKNGKWVLISKEQHERKAQR